ncbi:MAG: hypothetical protein FWD08_03060, partial [Alphaproteobacteria bacterium]|nr:hypothetical protein [Alphaproteobacteria bacterium]
MKKQVLIHFFFPTRFKLSEVIMFHDFESASSKIINHRLAETKAAVLVLDSCQRPQNTANLTFSIRKATARIDDKM